MQKIQEDWRRRVRKRAGETLDEITILNVTPTRAFLELLLKIHSP
jgi:hypothetical protein